LEIANQSLKEYMYMVFLENGAFYYSMYRMPAYCKVKNAELICDPFSPLKGMTSLQKQNKDFLQKAKTTKKFLIL